MRLLALGLCIAAVAAPAATAKGRITVRLGDSTPSAGRRFTVLDSWRLASGLDALGPGAPLGIAKGDCSGRRSIFTQSG
jgi:hypothetical protein